ncbi:hypothetical protein F511_16141, partial [Dorcoceras hygrometricum]
FIMASRKDDSLQSISVQLDGTNYTYWSYVMKNFLRGKSMWSYVTGVWVKPIDDTATDYAVLVDNWEVANSWINNSVTHSIGIQLAKYETAKEVWDHLARLYTQSNFAKQYQLETDIRALQQNDMSIQEFYSAMSNLWDQLALTESDRLRVFEPYIARREEQRLVQFLMALRNDFEGLRGTILHRSPLPSVDSVVNELLAEEFGLNLGHIRGMSHMCFRQSLLLYTSLRQPTKPDQPLRSLKMNVLFAKGRVIGRLSVRNYWIKASNNNNDHCKTNAHRLLLNVHLVHLSPTMQLLPHIWIHTCLSSFNSFLLHNPMSCLPHLLKVCLCLIIQANRLPYESWILALLTICLLILILLHLLIPPHIFLS